MHFTLLKREKKYHGKIIDLTVDHLQYPSGTTTVREIIEHPGGAVILCLFGNDDILLIRQYRHPFGHDVIELPAGKLDAGEDPLLCAQRELREETGFAARHWEKLTALYATPGFCNEILHVYLARDPYEHEQGQALEEGEASIRILRVPFSEAISMIERQEIVDGKTIAGILLGARKTGHQ
jgi:ADP-ribose pyrophosphatase